AAAATVDEAAIRAQERQRLAGLQVLDSDYPEQKALIEQCRNDGTSLRDAEHLVMSADRKLRRSELTELRSRGVASTLANGNEDVIASAGAFDEATVRARYASSKEMQERYGSADAAVRWERARAQVAAE
ncbi:MAG TPA: hypothetical protein VEL28_21020, partial [Candidatus Binatia bacterium]|nr:hypothetical protein [Candidatus Binatia bacterium]